MSKKKEIEVAATPVVALPDEAKLAYEMLGAAKMALGFKKLTTVVSLQHLKEIKERKLYRYVAVDGVKNGAAELPTVGDFGTWADFCEALGTSASKVDEDLANLAAFGEEALDGMRRIGAGYRDLRQYRKLPEGDRVALIEVAKTGDKEDFVELAEQIITKHIRESDAKDQQIEELSAELTDTSTQRDTAEAEAEALRRQLAQRTERADKVPLVVAELRAEIAAQAKAAELAIGAFQGIGEDTVALGAAGASKWQDATLRLAVAGLMSLRLQLQGHIEMYLRALPEGDIEPASMSSFTPQEAHEAAERFATLTAAHEYGKQLRKWEREQEQPRGKGRPTVKPKAPKGVA